MDARLSERLHQLVWDAARKVGLSAPRIADEVAPQLAPMTWGSAQTEGLERVVRLGLIELVKPILRAANDDDGQMDLGDIDPAFFAVVRPLKSNTYFVPSVGEQVPLSRLIAAPMLLDEARKFMRKKGNETLEEADRLDQVFDAVIAAARGDAA